jgi:hypothetical protein
MRKYVLMAAVVVGAVAVTGPAASAQALAFSATYDVKAAGHNGTPSCPGSEVVCGTGTSAQFGAFSYALTYPNSTTNLVELAFADGSVLALDETFQYFSTPGNSGDSNATTAFGNPNDIFSTWTLDTALSSPTFSSFGTGAGTDTLRFAGVAGHGVITGTLG